MPGYLARLHEKVTRTGAMRVSVSASSSFGSPWRCDLELFGDTFTVVMIAWAASGRRDFGSSELRMYQALDTIEPLEERGMVPATTTEIAALRAAEHLDTVVEPGILDGWQARIAYADDRVDRAFDLRCHLPSRTEHARWLDTFVSIARRGLTSSPSLRALGLWSNTRR
jgi:hypothetical protein